MMAEDLLTRAALLVAAIVALTTVVSVVLALTGIWSNALTLIIVDAVAIAGWVALSRRTR